MSYHGHREGCYGNVRRLQRVHSRRSNRTKRIDESLRAPLAKSDEQWLVQAIEYLNIQMAMMENIICHLVEKTNNLPAKADLEKLQKISTQMTHIDAVMSSIETKQSQPEVSKKEKGDASYVR
jgi:hypothetical protein